MSGGDLVWACQRGEVGEVRRLLRDPGVDVNARVVVVGWRGRTALDEASEGGRLEVVGMLLQAPCIDVNRADVRGLTPLHWASVRGHLEVVQALLRAPGVDVNHADGEGRTPLCVACSRGHAEVAMALVEAGADVAVTDRGGRSPLRLFCEGLPGGVERCVRDMRATAGPMLTVLLLGGLPPRIADSMVMGCLDGRERLVAGLLRAGAAVPRRPERLRGRRR